jgi:hypothetical protein
MQNLFSGIPDSFSGKRNSFSPRRGWSLAAISLLAIAVSMGVAGCNRDDDAPPPEAPPPPPPHLSITILAQLPSARATHLATIGSEVYALQEPPGENSILVLQLGKFTPTGIDAKTLSTAFGTNGTAGASGAAGGIETSAAIESIATYRSRLYAFFISADGQSPALGVAAVDPTGVQPPRIIVNRADLMTQSGMADAVNLARGDLIASGPTLWLWLHSDFGGCLLPIITQPAAPLAPPTTQPNVSLPAANAPTPPGNGVLPPRRITTLTTDALPLRLNQAGLQISPVADGTLAALDIPDGAVWTIRPDGYAFVRQWFLSPTAAFSPLVDADHGAVAALACPGEATAINNVQGNSVQGATAQNTGTAVWLDEMPMWVLFGNKIGEIRRADMQATGFDLDHINITAIIDGSQPRSYLAYDATTGQVLTIVQSGSEPAPVNQQN